MDDDARASRIQQQLAHKWQMGMCMKWTRTVSNWSTATFPQHRQQQISPGWNQKRDPASSDACAVMLIRRVFSKHSRRHIRVSLRKQRVHSDPDGTTLLQQTPPGGQFWCCYKLISSRFQVCKPEYSDSFFYFKCPYLLSPSSWWIVDYIESWCCDVGSGGGRLYGRWLNLIVFKPFQYLAFTHLFTYI